MNVELNKTSLEKLAKVQTYLRKQYGEELTINQVIEWLAIIKVTEITL